MPATETTTVPTLIPAPRPPSEPTGGRRPGLQRARLAGQGRAVPPPMDQQQLWDGYFARHFAGNPVAAQVFRTSGITTRHGVVNPLHEDISSWTTGQRMARYVEDAMPLGRRAVTQALERAGLDPADVGLFCVVSCTGYATPGLDIRLAEDLGMPADVQRLVVGHMGCYAAIPGLGAVSDFVVARQRPAVMLCIELTSLHPQPSSATVLAGTPTRKDVEQLVAHALFADAASAVVLVPGQGEPSGRDPVAGLEVVDVAAVTDGDSQHLMSWDVTDTGFRMGLSAQVPDVLAGHVESAVDGLLHRNGHRRQDVAGWAVHPGGRRILEVVQSRLGLEDGALAASYGVLADYGNCSSPTVLLVLERLVATQPVPAGAPVVAMAFGPGLTLYAALLRRS